MKNLKTKVAGLVLAVGVAGGLMAAPAFGASDFNANGANCHGVLVSNAKAWFGGNPAQISKATGIPVKDLQDYARELCSE